VLGYELDLKYLTRLEKKEVAGQIAFYKKHRRLFQFGRFSRIKSDKNNQTFWQCTENQARGRFPCLTDKQTKQGDGSSALQETAAIIGFFQGRAETADGHSVLRINGLDADKTYMVRTKPQRIFIKRFGGLLKHILPVELDPNGLILRIANSYHTLWDCAEQYTGDGNLLAQGIYLNNQFMGTHYNPETELLGDFGSYLFTAEEVKIND